MTAGFLSLFVEGLVEIFGVVAGGCDGEEEDTERIDMSLQTNGRSVLPAKVLNRHLLCPSPVWGI